MTFVVEETCDHVGMHELYKFLRCMIENQAIGAARISHTHAIVQCVPVKGNSIEGLKWFYRDISQRLSLFDLKY